jgi:hypothetical protein
MLRAAVLTCIVVVAELPAEPRLELQLQSLKATVRLEGISLFGWR